MVEVHEEGLSLHPIKKLAQGLRLSRQNGRRARHLDRPLSAIISHPKVPRLASMLPRSNVSSGDDTRATPQFNRHLWTQAKVTLQPFPVVNLLLHTNTAVRGFPVASAHFLPRCKRIKKTLEAVLQPRCLSAIDRCQPSLCMRLELLPAFYSLLSALWVEYTSLETAARFHALRAGPPTHLPKKGFTTPIPR